MIVSGETGVPQVAPSSGGPPFLVDPRTRALYVEPTASPLGPFLWQIDGTSSATVLTPPAYQTAHAYSTDDVVQMPRGVYGGLQLPYAYALCTTAGTSGSSAAGASGGVQGLGAGVADGTGGLVWTIVPIFAGGLTFIYSTGTPLVGGPTKQYLPVPTSAPFAIADNGRADPATVWVSGGKVSVYGSP